MPQQNENSSARRSFDRVDGWIVVATFFAGAYIAALLEHADAWRAFGSALVLSPIGFMPVFVIKRRHRGN